MRPRRPLLRIACAATFLMLASPTLAAPGAVQDFRLPPAQPDEAERPQGPVVPDVPASREVLRPEPAPTQTPPPTVAPVPPTTPPPRIVLPPPAPSAPAPASGPSPSPTATAAPAETSPPADEVPEALEPTSSPTPTFTPSPLPSPAATEPAEESGAPLPWIIAALAALAALALGAWLWRRQSPASATLAPRIERPKPAAPPPAAPEPDPLPPAEPMQLELEPLRFSLTLMNAALSYRLVLNNRSQQPLSGLKITADMISAHASLSREEQLCGPDAGAMQVAFIERLEPGESHAITGEFRVPLNQVVPIRQGSAALLLPLARFRIQGVQGEPLTRTFLVAQPPEQPGAGLQPFRLDQGPRIYPKLAQRAFA